MPRMRAPDGSELQVESPEGIASMKALGWTDVDDESRRSQSPRTESSNTEQDEGDETRPRRRPGRPRKSE